MQEVSDGLWDVLAVREDTVRFSKQLLSGETKHLLIGGPPGAGKTTLARQIAATLESKGMAAFRAVGDEMEANRRLYALRRADAATSDIIKPIAAASKAMADIAIKIVTKGEYDAKGALEVFDAEKARQRQSVVFLEQDEQEILADLQRNTLGGEAVLIADNLHWWDKDSLSLLGMMLDGRVAEAFPFTRHLRVVAVVTDDTYQPPIWLGDYKKSILPYFSDEISLRYCDGEKFPELHSLLDPDLKVSDEDARLIFQMSGGHLMLLSRALQYVGETSRGGPILDTSRVLEDMFLERLRKIGSIGELARNFLDAASIIGTKFQKSEVLCILKSDQLPVFEAIQTCLDLGFVEQHQNTFEFRHDYIRHFFKQRLGAKELHWREVFSECLRQLTPGDYRRRAENFQLAKDDYNSSIYFAIAAIENVRNGRSFDHMLPVFSQAEMHLKNYEDFLKKFEKGFHCYARGENEDASRTLNTISENLPEPLFAELEYLKGHIDLASRSIQRRHSALRRLQNWENYELKEYEIGLRLMLLRRSMLVLEKDKIEASQIDHKIQRSLSARHGFDPQAKVTSYALLRSAEALNAPEYSIAQVQEAVRFFEPDSSGASLNPTEYFKSLNNLTAIHFSQGQYVEALKVAERAVDLAIQYSSISFPRKDYIYSQHLLNRFRLDQVTPEEAAIEQHTIILEHSAEDDPFYSQNYLSVYYGMSEKFDLGIEILESLAEQLSKRGTVEHNPMYFVSSNLICLQYLLGHDAKRALKRWDEIEAHVENIPYETRYLLCDRHRVMRQIFVDSLKLTPRELDIFPITQTPRPLHPSYCEIGRGFRMPDVQFWSPM